MNLKKKLTSLIKEKFNTLFLQYFLIISAIVIIPLSISSLIYYQYYSISLEEELENANRHTALKVKDVSEMVFDEVGQLILQLCVNKDLEQIVSYNSTLFPDYNAMKRYTSLISSFDTTTMTSKYIHSISVYSIPNEHVFSSLFGSWEKEYYTDNSWIDETLSNKDINDFYIESRNINYGLEDTRIISFNRFFPIDSNYKKGIISLNIDVLEMSDLISNINENYFEKIAIFDNEGNIILYSDYKSSPDFFESTMKQFSGQDSDSSIIEYNGTKYVATLLASNNSYFNYLFATPVDIFESKLMNLRKFMMLTLLIAALFSLALAYLIAKKVYQPIKNIRNIIKNDKNLSVEYRNNKNDEYKYITESMKHTFKLSSDIEKEINYRIELLDKAKAAALQAHINPHFLCNTLESINLMAIRKLDATNEISQMVVSLSSLLRQSLQTENAFIDLKKEIDYAKEYISIQQYRYDYSFDVKWNISKECLDLKVIKIMLQPPY